MSYLPLINTALLLITLAGLITLFARSTQWTAPIQHAMLEAIRETQVFSERRLASAEEKIQKLFDEAFTDRKTTMKTVDRLLERVEELNFNEHIRSIEARSDKMEQEQETTLAILRSLACADQKWLREKPTFCPLYQRDCPLKKEEEADGRSET